MTLTTLGPSRLSLLDRASMLLLRSGVPPKHRVLRWWFVLAAVVLVTACGDGGGSGRAGALVTLPTPIITYVDIRASTWFQDGNVVVTVRESTGGGAIAGIEFIVEQQGGCPNFATDQRSFAWNDLAPEWQISTQQIVKRSANWRKPAGLGPVCPLTMYSVRARFLDAGVGTGPWSAAWLVGSHT